MNFFKKLSLFTKDSIIFVLIIGMCVGVLLGSTFPPQLDVRSLGPYQISTYPTGISLYQHGHNGPYYTISPLNDYYITQQDERFALLSIENFNAQNYSINTPNDLKPWEKILPSLQAYTNNSQIQLTIHSDTTSEYLVDVFDNIVQIQRTTIFPQEGMTQKIGNTLQYSEGDIVFDKTTQKILSENSEEQVTQFNTLHRQQLQLLKEHTIGASESALIRQKVSNKKVILFNPSQSGALEIDAINNQQLFVDPFFRLIEVEQLTSPDQTQTSTMYTLILEDL